MVESGRNFQKFRWQATTYLVCASEESLLDGDNVMKWLCSVIM